MTLHEVVQNATQIAHGVTSAVRGLGGTVVPLQTVKTDEAQTGSTDVWAAAGGSAAEEEPPNPIYDQIKDAADVPALQRLWAENQPAFKDADVLAAWKARGKALSAAATSA